MCVVNVVLCEPGKSLVESYDTWREIADTKACCDFVLFLHILM